MGRLRGFVVMGLVAAALGVAADRAGATGFGTGLAAPVLGQTLDQTVQVRTDPNDPLEARCIGAEVYIGERRLPAGLVRMSLETTGPETARIRILSSQVVDEPVVTITLSAGCISRVSRRYVLLVEPPALGNPAPVVAANDAGLAAVPAPPPVVVAAPATAPATASATAPAATAPSPSDGAMATRTAAATASTAAPAVRRTRTSTAPRETARAAPRPRVAARTTTARTARSARPARTARAATPAPAVPATTGPRLRLEPAETFAAAAPAAASAGEAAVEQALLAVAQAASAARAAASAASAAQARIAGLEQTVEQLRGEAKAQRDLAAQLRAQLEQTQSSGRWIGPLLTLVLLLAALALWLAWRLGSVQRGREADWRAAATPGPSAAGAAGDADRPAGPAIPFVTSEIRPASPGAASRPRVAPAWPPPAPAADPWPGVATVSEVRPAGPPPFQPEPEEPPSARSSTLSPPPGVAPIPPRDVSIEELIDLEQQAEFFVVLGQDEAAIDLLVEHLRNTGGGSPLPYLKLLEIYRRRSDREAYERMRSRFNRRFNAYAPEWGVDLTHGRSLEDYPGVVPRLQELWPRPLDAMAELEALLFRKSRGDLFDLPAYREVLFLYSLARDLLDREGAATGSVDLLLPMGDGGEFGVTAPHPYLGLESDAIPLERDGDRAVTMPVDFDVGMPRERPTSIFGSLDEPETQPRTQPIKRG